MSLRPALAALLVLAACRAPTEAAAMLPTPALPGAEVWVEATRLQSGDGSREHPFRTLAEALAVRHAPTVHVGPGLYAGPFVLPSGARVVGAGESTVLYVEGLGPLVRLEQAGELSQLSLQGGGWGVEASAGVLKLEGVAFSGQRQGAVRVTGGQLVAHAVQFDAGVSETVGLWVEGPATAQVRQSTFTGPWQRAVQVLGGAQAELEGVEVHQAVMALEQQGGRVRLSHVSVEGGRGPGLLVRDGVLELEEVRVTGHEYGLASNGATLQVRGFTSVGAERAGLGLARSTGRLEQVHVSRSGSFGALQLVDSDLEVSHFQVDDVDAYGVAATQGKLRARHGLITRLRSKEGFTGDGLHLRGVVADIEDVEVREAAGSGVLAAQGAQVVLRGVTLSGCQEAGLAVESQARVKAERLEVHGTQGPALAVLRDTDVQVDTLTASQLGQGLVWAECEGQTRLLLEHVHADDRRGLTAPCVQALP